MNNFLGNIYFAPSKTCNLRCTYCYVPEMNKNVKTSLKEVKQSFKNFIDKLIFEDFDVDEICFHGAEPTTVDPKFYDFAQKYFIKKMGREPNFNMQTNGTMLEKFLPILNPTYFKIGISLDAYEENNDKYRGNGNFKKTFDNMKKAKEMGFNVSTILVVNKETWLNFDKLKEYIQTLIDMEIIISIKTIATTAEDPLSLFNEYGYEYGKKMYEQGWFDLLQVSRNDICMRMGNNCTFLEFDYQGNVFSCNKAFSDNKIISNWKTQTFKEIIDKRIGLYSEVKKSEECKTCKYEVYCQSWCPSARMKSGHSHECLVLKGAFDCFAGDPIFLIEETTKMRKQRTRKIALKQKEKLKKCLI